jgi:transposase-like protein
MPEQKRRQNGTNASGNQQYHCKDCGAYGVMDPEQKGYSDEEKERILRAYRERGSLRGVERIFGVSRGTVLRWLKKRGKN